uniref:Uncharacterized protein n=1 Tax=Rhodnius prolixus TaxID=13249 RepID=T1HUI8_RHOPR
MSDGNVLNAFFWLIILVVLSWWIASFCFVPYVIVSVLTPCISGLKQLSDVLLAGIMLPYKCSDNMIHRRLYCTDWNLIDSRMYSSRDISFGFVF